MKRMIGIPVAALTGLLLLTSPVSGQRQGNRDQDKNNQKTKSSQKTEKCVAGSKTSQHGKTMECDPKTGRYVELQHEGTDTPQEGAGAPAPEGNPDFN